MDATVDRDVLLSSSLLHSRSHSTTPSQISIRRLRFPLPWLGYSTVAARQLHDDPKGTWVAAVLDYYRAWPI
jgi:hypothetical protein